MTGDHILLDPTSELSSVQRARRPRPSSIDGLTVGLLDISKKRGDIFLDCLADLLTERGLTVRRYRKARFSVLAPLDLKQQIQAECNLVVEALAD
jgi:hypothetical protein